VAAVCPNLVGVQSGAKINNLGTHSTEGRGKGSSMLRMTNAEREGVICCEKSDIFGVGEQASHFPLFGLYKSSERRKRKKK